MDHENPLWDYLQYAVKIGGITVAALRGCRELYKLGKIAWLRRQKASYRAGQKTVDRAGNRVGNRTGINPVYISPAISDNVAVRETQINGQEGQARTEVSGAVKARAAAASTGSTPTASGETRQGQGQELPYQGWD